MVPPVLSDNVRGPGLLALTVLVLERDASTRDLASEMEMTTVRGETVSGAKAAETVLIESLLADPSGWVQWLTEPDHANAAASLGVVLTSAARDRVTGSPAASQLGQLLGLLDQARATRRALAHEIATEASVIDLTDRSPQKQQA